MAERKKMSLTMKILIGLILGLITGVIINYFFIGERKGVIYNAKYGASSPISGAKVAISNDSSSENAVDIPALNGKGVEPNLNNTNPFLTDSQGRFAFALSPDQIGKTDQPATYVVSVSAEGFSSRQIQITLSPKKDTGLFQMTTRPLDKMPIAVEGGYKVTSKDVLISSTDNIAFNIPMFTPDTLKTVDKDKPTMFKNAFVGTWIVNGLFLLGGGIFLNLLKMLVVPLVTFSLIAGVCGIGDIAALGRIGIKSFLLYVLTTAIAISTAILLAIWIGPGEGLGLKQGIGPGYEAKEAPPITKVFIDIIPSNPVKAFAEGEMLSIIFYSILVGVALLMLGKVAKQVVEATEVLNEIAMKLVDIVMSIAHIGVFCLIAKTFAEQGIDLILPMASYFLTVLGALGIHFFVTILVLFYLFTRLNPITFMKKMQSAQTFAFSTASSGATIPVTLQSVTERLGVKNSVASFTVPLGATINMDGTAIMQGVATVFIANAFDIPLGIGGYVTVIGMAVLASIGTAGVPGVGLIMLAMVLNQVGLPVEGIALIIGVDRLLDMCRTAVNITGDAMVSTVVAKGENKIDIDTYNNPDAGTIDFDKELDIDDEDEKAFKDIMDTKLT